MSDAVHGKGALFKRGDGASNEAFTTLAEVRSIDWSGFTRGVHDVTPLDATAGYRVFKGGYRDPGTITLEMNFKLSEYDKLLGDFDNDDAWNYQIELPTSEASIFEFSALITDLPPFAAGDRPLESVGVTFKVTGQPTLTS